MNKTIAILNQKGGSGKTTTTVNLGAALARKNHSVLLIDCDPQAHLTYSLGVEAHSLKYTINEVLQGEVPASEALVDCAGMKIIPSNLALSGAEMQLISEPGREFLLKNAIEDIRDQFDFVLIDCPPSLALLTLNALTAADSVLIPVQTEFLALQGVSTLLKTIDLVQSRLNRNLKILGVFAVRYDSRKVLNREIVEAAASHFENKLFEAKIRENIALAEAPANGKDIFDYAGKSTGAIDYEELCNEFLERVARG